MLVRPIPRQFAFIFGLFLLVAGIFILTGVAAETSAKTGKRSVPSTVAADKAVAEAKRAHVQATEVVAMPHAPPAIRVENQPPSPVPGYVWVPGHWTPVKGEWKWAEGKWQLPPTPISVWIEAKYDAKTRQWNAGYWQPDRPDSYEGEAVAPAATTPPAR